MTTAPPPDITPLYREEFRWRLGWTAESVAILERMDSEKSAPPKTGPREPGKRESGALAEQQSNATIQCNGVFTRSS